MINRLICRLFGHKLRWVVSGFTIDCVRCWLDTKQGETNGYSSISDYVDLYGELPKSW